MKTIFPDEIPEEMKELREETDSIDESLKPILDADEKLRKLTESTSSALSKITASSSMLSAFQGYRVNPIFRCFGELDLSSAIPKYRFTNPVLQQIKETSALGNMAAVPNEKIEIDCIYRGNISSTYFKADGDEILHCSSIFEQGNWLPLLCHCKDYPRKNAKYVQNGDIIVNRIGKNAGFWTKYVGERKLVSDCLIVIRGGIGIEGYLKQHSNDGRLEIPLKGVATKYISISDLLSSFFTQQVAVVKKTKPS